MRALSGLALFVCGCQLLSQNRLLCTESDLCDQGTGQPFVLGQPDANTNRNNTGMSAPLSVFLTQDGKLLVTDTGNSRLLIWNTFPTKNYQPVDYVLGNTNASVQGATWPQNTSIGYVSAEGDTLVVSGDRSTNLINQYLLWKPFPTQHTAPLSNLRMSSGGQFWMAGSGGPLLSGGRLYLSESAGNRVLTWDVVPTSVTSPNAALGQTSLTAIGANGISSGMPSNNSFSGPSGSPATDGTQLLVADTNNHRVLVFSALPKDNTAMASFALGQASFATAMANSGGIDQSSLNQPRAVAIAGNRVAVADTGNNRVLLWNTPIGMMKQPADIVLGQSNPTTVTANSGGVDPSRMNGPCGVAMNSTRLVVADTANNRVLVWNTWPSSTGAAADFVLGQPTGTGSAADGLSLSETSFAKPVAMARAKNAFLVADSAANRILVYGAPPQSPAERPIAVLGQTDFVSGGAPARPPHNSSLAGPLGVSSDGDNVAVADTDNHRVLLFRGIAGRNAQPADVVIGQPNGTTFVANNPSPATGLSSPSGVFLGGGKLYVADTGNHRVLIWNSIPAKDGQPPDVVLGQANFATISANRGAGAVPSAGSMNGPRAVIADGKAIYVADTLNSRVLVFPTLTPMNGESAVLALGQQNLTTVNAAKMALPTSLPSPWGLSLFNNRLYVADTATHRVTSFDLLGSSLVAARVFGQPDLYTGTPNSGGLSVSRFYGPQGILVVNTGMYIADALNARVVVVPLDASGDPLNLS
jgi:hypothetical protein